MEPPIAEERRQDSNPRPPFAVSDPVSDEDVDWLECISAIETHRGVLYFCDSAYFAKHTNGEKDSLLDVGSNPVGIPHGAILLRKKDKCRNPYRVSSVDFPAVSPCTRSRRTIR